MKTWICNPAYIYGGEKRNYKNLSNFYNKLESYDMPDMPELWGWGDYCVSHAHRYDLAGEVVTECLKSFPANLDHIIISSCEISETFMSSNDRLNSLLTRHNLIDMPVTGVSLTGCNNLISALMLAQGLLLGGMAKNILLISEDTSHAEELRFDKHCIFSDGACAFILSTEINSGVELVDVRSSFSPASKGNDGDIFRSDLKKIHTSYFDFLSRHNLCESDLSTIITPNYYSPVLEVLFSGVGMNKKKRFDGNASQYGHCFSCDYLINLKTYLAIPNADKKNILLFAYADMHYGFCLIRSHLHLESELVSVNE